MASLIHVATEPDRHIFDLTLAILGVIQGLAFSHVAEKLPRITGRYTRTENTLIFAVYAVCVLIVVRVFQTYALAAIDGILPKKMQFSDLLGMFAVGLLEYWVFDAIGKYRTNFIGLFNRVSLLGIAAIILHSKARSYISGIELSAADRASELSIANTNIAFAAVIAVLAFAGGTGLTFLVESLPTRRICQVVVALLIAAALVANIAYSLLADVPKHSDQALRAELLASSASPDIDPLARVEVFYVPTAFQAWKH